MVKVGIVGAAGYTAGELIRLILNHPEAALVWCKSESFDGQPLYAVHKDLLGETDMSFRTGELSEVDVVFLCMGHGRSRSWVEANDVSGVKIVDLSHDFRLDGDHDFLYALPEMNKADIPNRQYIANPGCFATAIQLAILPLADAQSIGGDIHVNAVTGSTGAGQQPGATTHFSWRTHNLSIYKAFTHQHLGEINQSVKGLQNSFEGKINFVPVRGPFSRGIMATAYTQSDWSLDQAYEVFEKYYADSPFVHVTRDNPDLKQVVNTNKGVIYLEKHDDQLLIVSMIDNLLKGASGQAVQNMNIQFGLSETAGLNLKSIVF